MSVFTVAKLSSILASENLQARLLLHTLELVYKNWFSGYNNLYQPVRRVLFLILFQICLADLVCFNPKLSSGFQQTYNLTGFKAKSFGLGFFAVRTVADANVFSILTTSLCEPNHRFTLLSTPNDPRYPDVAHILKSIRAEKAWSMRGLRKTYVAVVDTGIEWHHPDLKGRVELGLSFNAAGEDTSDFDDYDGHGTHVAGIIAARANNGEGGLGVSNNARLISVKITDNDGEITLGYVVNAFTYLAYLKDFGIDLRLINASFGGYAYSQILYQLVQELSKRRIILVAAAGNESLNFDQTPIYPAGFKLPNVVSVASGFLETDGTGWLSIFSNYGKNVKIIAPGSNVLSTYLDHEYEIQSGTSMATPYVTGALAVYLGLAPRISNKDIISDLTSTCSKVQAFEGYANRGCYLNVNTLVKKARQRAARRR